MVRPILPSDAPELADAIRTADSATLHTRFLGSPPPITDALLDKLTQVDYVSQFALVAFARGRGVAIARYIALPATEDGAIPAEVAVVVAPKWRRVGLATALLQMLVRRADECGITHFTALFLAENRPVVELARTGNAKVAIARGMAQVEAPLASRAETVSDGTTIG